MSIILRVNKGQALTYDEMDRNQSQFFYSSSLHDSNTKLRLHYTGSDSLDSATEDYGPSRYQEIPFPTIDTSILQPTAAGNNKEIQYNDNGVFGTDALFVFDKTTNSLGLGTATPLDRFEIQGDRGLGATVSLKSSTLGLFNAKHATINFLEGSTYLGRVGRASSGNKNLYFVNNAAVDGGFGKVHISIGTGDSSTDNADDIVAATFTRTSSGVSKLGVGTKLPNRQASLVGTLGLGISATGDNNLQSFLTPLPAGIFNSTNGQGQHDLIPNNSEPTGLLISSPIQANGGNIVLAINTDTVQQNEGFNIIKANTGDYTNSSVIFSAQASGKIGINTNFPSEVGLTVAGNISGSGTLQIETISTGTAVNTSTLVTTSTGLIQKIVAAPVPLGGIIMWSGAVASIPDGWQLCDGTGTTPNLVDRFIVGAGSTYAVDETGGSPDAVVVTHNHGGTTASNGNHNHYVAVAGTQTTGSVNSLYDGTGVGRQEQGLSTRALDQAQDAFDYELVTVTGTQNAGATNTTGAHTHTINNDGESGINKNLPPYYALAFIMYTGA